MPEARILKWGNSLAVRIPKAVAEELHLEAGDSVKLTASEGRIELRHATPTLDELVAGITPENRHGETDWGTRRREGNDRVAVPRHLLSP